MREQVILIIDDEEGSVAYASAVLREEGRTIISARDGAAGLRAARSEHPDLVILNVQMPKMDGFTLFSELRHDEATKDIPVIMLTGVGEKTGVRFSASDMGEFLGVEPEGYVEKPIDEEALETTVARILGS